MIEEWKLVKGFENYLVSNLGRIIKKETRQRLVVIYGNMHIRKISYKTNYF